MRPSSRRLVRHSSVSTRIFTILYSKFSDLLNCISEILWSTTWDSVHRQWWWGHVSNCSNCYHPDNFSSNSNPQNVRHPSSTDPQPFFSTKSFQATRLTCSTCSPSSSRTHNSSSSFLLIIAISLNLLFIICRINSHLTPIDEVFTEPTLIKYPSHSSSSLPLSHPDFDYAIYPPNSTSWNRFFAQTSSTTVLLLSIFSLVNAYFAFSRKRHYRLFETSIHNTPNTPSAKLVPVSSSLDSQSSRPISTLSTSYTWLTNFLKRRPIPPSSTHPNYHQKSPNSLAYQNDVWQLSIWDPVPLCLQLFCFFSPAHVIAYYVILSPIELDAHSNISLLIALLLGITLSLQLSFLQTSHSQSTLDKSFLHREVMNEFNVKYVQPRISRPMHSLAVQVTPHEATSSSRSTTLDQASSCDDLRPQCQVDQYPATIPPARGYSIHPNLAYSEHYDPNNLLKLRESSSTPYQRPLNLKNESYSSSNHLSDRPIDAKFNQAHSFNRSSPTSSYTSFNLTARASSRCNTRFSKESSKRSRSIYSLHDTDETVTSPSTQSSKWNNHHESSTCVYTTVATPTKHGNSGGSLGVYSHAASPLNQSRYRSSRANIDEKLYFGKSYI